MNSRNLGFVGGWVAGWLGGGSLPAGMLGHAWHCDVTEAPHSPRSTAAEPTQTEKVREQKNKNKRLRRERLESCRSQDCCEEFFGARDGKTPRAARGQTSQGYC